MKKLLPLLFVFSLIVSNSRAQFGFPLYWQNSGGGYDPIVCGHDYIGYWVPPAYYNPAYTYKWFISQGACGSPIQADSLPSIIYNGTSYCTVQYRSGTVWVNAYDSNNQPVANSFPTPVVNPDANGSICTNSFYLCNDRPTVISMNQYDAWQAVRSAYPSVQFNWQFNGVDIPGQDGPQLKPTAAGEYRVRFTTSCGTGYSFPVNILTGGPGFGPAISGISPICSGSTTTLTAYGLNSSINNYQYLWNTGVTTQSISAGMPGQYTVTITNSNGCSQSTNFNLITNQPVTPVITPSGPTTFCQGTGSLVLNGIGQGQNYYDQAWYRGPLGTIGYNYEGQNTSITPTITGTYFFQVRNACGTFNSAPVDVIINQPSIIPVTLSTPGPVEYCGSSLFNLNVSPSGTGYTYKWYRDGAYWTTTTTSSMATGTAGTFYVEIVGPCVSGTSNSLTVTFVSSVPPRPGNISGPASVCLNQQGVVYSIAPVSGASSYLWTVPTNATIISGQGTTSITVYFGNKVGNVTVKSVNVCGTSSSRNKKISRITGCRTAGPDVDDILQNEDAVVVVFPNPASNQLNIRVSEVSFEKVNIIIHDISGRVVFQTEEEFDEEIFERTIPVNGLRDGIYLLRISSRSWEEVRKVIIQKENY